MKKRFIYLPMIVLSALLFPQNKLDLPSWYKDNDGLTRTVNNGCWSDDPADAPTDEEIGKMLDTACKVQTAVSWNEFFFLAVRNPEEQKNIVGDYWGKNPATRGTVTILILSDQIESQKNHKAKYEGYYTQSALAYFDSGMASSVLALCAQTMGYNTHFFGYLTGKSVAKNNGDNDFGLPRYDISRFVKGKKYSREWGLPDKRTAFDVEGNCALIGCVVIGKPDKDIDARTAATQHKRPKNWAIWD
jgi:hypothetical protein